MKMSDAEKKMTFSKGGTKHKRARQRTGVIKLPIYPFIYRPI